MYILPRQRTYMHSMLRFFKTCRTKTSSFLRQIHGQQHKSLPHNRRNFINVVFTTSAAGDVHRPYQKGKRAVLQNMPATHLRTPRRLQRPPQRTILLLGPQLPENSWRRRRTSHKLLTCHRINLNFLASGGLAFRVRFPLPDSV